MNIIEKLRLGLQANVLVNNRVKAMSMLLFGLIAGHTYYAPT